MAAVDNTTIPFLLYNLVEKKILGIKKFPSYIECGQYIKNELKDENVKYISTRNNYMDAIYPMIKDDKHNNILRNDYGRIVSLHSKEENVMYHYGHLTYNDIVSITALGLLVEWIPNEDFVNKVLELNKVNHNG